MRKKFLQGCKVNAQTHISQAIEWSKDMTRREARGPGDMENAWRRFEQRYGLPWRLFWSLRYRPPGGIDWDLFEQLRLAHRAECERQSRLLRHDVAKTEEIAGPHNIVVRAVRALAGPALEEDDELNL